ncbi:DJ-1/PfpI family protein [Rhizobiales bacterium]|uniref:DJ-1/PfpI family protein n=1 Tax=Hongsoonwoonella zoysiae TaxID=2821844 RepID=UPI00156127E2|nr:DJ-1/PfpI family protein [Hongsoonwoonella zoysiae]NRG16815.1 DJ-1/PfpI family protein [Hongsoonwoonella zoysiae]
MAYTIGILIFDGAEEMDFVGPWEVLAAAVEGKTGERVLTVAPDARPIVCEKGMRVIPDTQFDEAPALDVLIVPGGSGARREIGNPATVEWLRKTSGGCKWVTSVCTGAFLIAGSGIADGRRMTTHHLFIQAFREMKRADVVEGVRFVRDGNLVSAGGVMSGIEMSLWLVNELYGPETVERTKSYIAYDFPPRTSIEGLPAEAD